MSVLYMTLPSADGDSLSWREKGSSKNPNLQLTIAQTPLEHNISSEEYSKLWQELRHTGQDLDYLYEDCRAGTYQFKEKYDEIKKKETLNNALRQLYYSALTDKKKHEQDRDTYFKNDKDLIEMKEIFIDETQKLALSNSKYIEYNQRFALRREEFICQLLGDVSKLKEKSNTLQSDKQRLSKELNETRTSNFNLREELSDLNAKNTTLERNCHLLEQKRDQMKKEAEWMLRQNNKLKESNGRLEKELENMAEMLQKLKANYNEQDGYCKELQRTNSTLDSKCMQLNQIVDVLREDLTAFQKEMDQERSQWTKEKQDILQEMDSTKKKMEKARENNRNTLMKNQQLRKSLSTANHFTDLVTKDKVRAITKEQKTKRVNIELASHQLELINEVLELKNDFFCNQTRIRKGEKLNRRLEKNIEILRQRMQMLKEAPTAIDPLDGAHEYRELTRQKFFSQKKFVRSSAVGRPTTSTVTKFT
ncbi:uncharacterized protein LOC143468933 [Clavelina lepadiformis]|uniref:uncharacterized protein LOC143468933 n=1 Tax=Clavelina lepadiformis TaxID=159417 RepID=UPI004041292F